MSKEQLVPDFDLEVDSPEDFKSNYAEEDTSGPDSVDDDSDEKDAVEEEIQFPDDADRNVVAAYRFYREKGYIREDHKDFDGSPEALQTILAKEREADYEDVLSYLYESSPEFAKPLIEIIINKGKDATAEEIQELFSIAKPSAFNVEDLGKEEKAAEYLKQYYMSVFEDSEDEAEERLDLLRDKNKLTKEAQKILSIENERKGTIINKAVEDSATLRAQREQAEKAFEQQFAASMNTWRKDTIEKTREEFYTGAFKQRIENMLGNPKVLPMLVHFASFYNPNTGELDMTSFYKEAANSNVSRKKDNIQNYWNTSIGRSSGEIDENPKLDLSKYEIEL